MSDLSLIEKSKFEKLFGMRSGYVLNFSNRTFQGFMADMAEIDIYSGKYDYASCSKAHLLRRFWEVEPNHVVAKVLNGLIELAIEESPQRDNEVLLGECRRIIERLRQGAPVADLHAIVEELADKDFNLLIKSIRLSIDANEPEAGLDRLHTFVTKFLRRLCTKKGITISKDKPLHSLLGEYIKKMGAHGAIETKMTDRILKSSITNLEYFNGVRNDHSLAHDNQILNYDESLLIFNHVVSAIKFIMALEQRQESKNEQKKKLECDDIPF